MRFRSWPRVIVRTSLPGLAILAALALPPTLSALAAARAQDQPAPAVPETVEVIRDVVYGTGGGRPLKLHLVRPKARLKAPLPVVVWVHGGGWQGGNKEGGLRNVARLAQRGYAGASIEYRLSGEATFPAQIEDCKAAVRFLRAKAEEYSLDPKRIGVWGSSAGGHLVALLGTSGDVKELEGKGGHPEQSSRVQAVCDFFGPSDFLRMGEAPSNIDHLAANSPESRLIGGPIRENPDKVARANPITYVSKDDPPFLIMHGDRDMTVPLNQSQLLHDALKKAGVEAAFEVVPGAGHGFGSPQIDAKVDAFFDRHLRPERSAP